MTLIALFLGCSSPQPEAPKPAPEAKAKRTPPRKPHVTPRAGKVDLSTAEPMKLAEAGPGGEPGPTLSLVFASRGDGEIEPCG